LNARYHDKPDDVDRVAPDRTSLLVRWLSTAVGLAGLAIVYGAFTLPNKISDLSIGMLWPIPVEFAAVLLILAVVPRRFSRATGWFLAGLVTLVSVVKIADMAAFQAFARQFNPVLDFHLLDAAWNLMSGAIGMTGALGIVAALILALAVIALLAGRGIAALAGTVRRRPSFVLAASAPFLLAGFAASGSDSSDNSPWQNAARPFASVATSELMIDHVETFTTSLSNLKTFSQEASVDPVAGIAGDRLLKKLAGKDVLLVFVESYGRTVIDRALYAADIVPALDAFEETVAKRGFHAASGFVKAPTVGGQSWLSHGTLLSGLWVDNQRRYNALVTSDRATMVSDFSRAGWRTAAVLPAITLAWPEGSFFGYDAIYDHARLGYRGLPFNWVTMPDQYTLSALDRFERMKPDRPPLFAEVALISSHAPWTPVPSLVDWEDVGDGTIFNDQAMSGDPPEVVWSDQDRVRSQFSLSIDYAIDNLSSWVKNRLQRDFVLIILGDHQPAPIITGETDNRDVPIHVISDDPAVTEAFLRWGWSGGIIPQDTTPSLSMDAFRARFMATFSADPLVGAIDQTRRVDQRQTP